MIVTGTRDHHIHSKFLPSWRVAAVLSARDRRTSQAVCLSSQGSWTEYLHYMLLLYLEEHNIISWCFIALLVHHHSPTPPQKLKVRWTIKTRQGQGMLLIRLSLVKDDLLLKTTFDGKQPSKADHLKCKMSFDWTQSLIEDSGFPSYAHLYVLTLYIWKRTWHTWQ